VLEPSRITIRIPRPERHFVDCEVSCPGLLSGPHDFFLPVWTPGSYLIREYSKHVQGIEAVDGKGASLPVRKTAKNRWRVELPGDGECRLRYRVYARDLTVRTNHVDAERAFLTGAALYLCEESRRDGPFELRVEAPEGWGTHCPLPLHEGRFSAADYDELVDCPVLCGDFETTGFEVHGVEHLCVHDGTPRSDRESLTRDLERIVRANAAVFGNDLPYERYVFLLLFDEKGSGGLEHGSSCVIHVPRSQLRTAGGRRRLLALLAHEHFHAWNVKRIRPEGLERFDYERENYCRGLWLAEGFTSYYQELIPYRAGLFSRNEMLRRIAKNAGEVLETPGRRVQSLSESSFDAWIKLYRPDEDSRNATVSYYAKGALAAFCLDVLIQTSSGGRRSLDDVMRALWEDARNRGPGQELDLVRRAASAAAGRDLGREFSLLFESTEDPPLEEWLGPIGLRLLPPDGTEEPYLGIRTAIRDRRLFVEAVERDGPGEAMGLDPGDEIVALNGERVLPEDFGQVLEKEHRSGDEIRIQLFRRGLLSECGGRLGARRRGGWRLIEETEVFRG